MSDDCLNWSNVNFSLKRRFYKLIFKTNKSDKSTAKISVPVYDTNGKLEDFEVLDYWEWHERFNEIATYLENTLNL